MALYLLSEVCYCFLGSICSQFSRYRFYFVSEGVRGKGLKGSVKAVFQVSNYLRGKKMIISFQLLNFSQNLFIISKFSISHLTDSFFVKIIPYSIMTGLETFLRLFWFKSR